MKAKAAPGKKPPAQAAKPGQGKMEDINDNRPRIVNYERDVAEANGGIGLEVTEEVAIRMSEAMLSLQVFDLDKET